MSSDIEFDSQSTVLLNDLFRYAKIKGLVLLALSAANPSDEWILHTKGP